MKSHLNHRKRAVSKNDTLLLANTRESSAEEPAEKFQSTTETIPKNAKVLKKKNTENLPFELIPGARTGSTMLYSISEKQLYRLKNDFTNYIRYVCAVTTCRATLYLRGEVLSKAPQFTDHNHSDKEAAVAKNKFEASYIAKCLEDGSDPSVVFPMMLNE